MGVERGPTVQINVELTGVGGGWKETEREMRQKGEGQSEREMRKKGEGQSERARDREREGDREGEGECEKERKEGGIWVCTIMITWGQKQCVWEQVFVEGCMCVNSFCFYYNVANGFWACMCVLSGITLGDTVYNLRIVCHSVKYYSTSGTWHCQSVEQ